LKETDDRLAGFPDKPDENGSAPIEPGGIKKRLILGIAASAVILALGLSLPAILDTVAPPSPSAETPQASLGLNAPDQFAFTVYTEGWKETVLQPDVAVTLNAYSPTRSDVPGLPFIVNSGKGVNADGLRVDVDAGTLITWGAPDYTAKERGRTYVLSSGDTIYWSPLDKTGKAVSSCTLSVTADDSGGKTYSASVAITLQTDSTYTAKLVKTES